MPSAPANGARNGPRPRPPDSARSRPPSVLRDPSRRRRADTPLIRSILPRQPTIHVALPTRSRSTAGVLTEKITMCGILVSEPDGKAFFGRQYVPVELGGGGRR